MSTIRIYPRSISGRYESSAESPFGNVDDEDPEEKVDMIRPKFSSTSFGTKERIRTPGSFFTTARRRIELFLLRLTMPKETFTKKIEKRFYELTLEEQTQMHDKKDLLFYWVRKGDLNSLKEKINDQLSNLSPMARAAREETLIDVRDAAGANIIHMAYLMGHYVIGHWLVETYPTIALLPYSGTLSEELLNKRPELREMKNINELMPYTGENILHMVIVRRNYEEVRWLLDFYKSHKDSVPHGLATLLTSKATGKFFDQKGSFYFGGYPLQFAVCSNSIEIFDLVLSFASSLSTDNAIGNSNKSADTAENLFREFQSLGPNVIFMRDSFGNTVLHLCVIHCLKTMYQHVHKTAENIIRRELKLLYTNVIQNDIKSNILKTYNLTAHDTTDSTVGFSLYAKKLRRPRVGRVEEWVTYEAKMKMEERLVLALNIDWHSPLTLAASQIKKNDIPELMKKKMDILTFILQQHRSVIYDYGLKVLCEINLDGLEIKYDLNNYDMDPQLRKIRHKHRSAIDWLCRCGAEPAVTMPDIRRVIEGKWNRWGVTVLLTKCFLSCLTVVAVTGLSILLSVDPTASPKNLAEVVTTVFYLFLWIIFTLLIFEAAVLVYNRVQWVHMQGVPRFHLVCKIVKIFSFALFCYFRINQKEAYDDGTVQYSNPVGVKLNLAVCIMASWMHLYYYLMAFEKTGPFMLTLTSIIGVEIPNFLKFYLITVIAFACGVSLVADEVDCNWSTGISNLFETLWALIQQTLHPLLPSSLDNADMSIVSENLMAVNDFLITVYHGVVNIIMLNILIAIINATYAYSTQYNPDSKAYNNEAILLIAKYNIMEFFELYLFPSMMKKARAIYCIIHRIDREYSPMDDPLYEECSSGDNLEEGFCVLDQKSPESSARLLKEVEEKKSETSPFLTIRHVFQVEEKQEYWTEGAKTESIEILHSNTSVFIIDPQIDFQRGGSFPIEGANDDSVRIATMIKKNKFFIHNIFVALDTHYTKHIAHASFWRDKYGNKPPVLTKISYRDVKSGVWAPRLEEDLEWCLKYTKDLERKGRMKLTIWPEHCLLGSRGHCVMPVINDALQEWAAHSKRPVQYVFKGYNYRTEMYSALEAEVVDPNDFSTSLNTELLSMLRISDKVIFLFKNLNKIIISSLLFCENRSC